MKDQALQLLSSSHAHPSATRPEGCRACARPRPGASVRLGALASASPRKAVAQGFWEGHLLDIWTCLGAPIKGYSYFPWGGGSADPPLRPSR